MNSWREVLVVTGGSTPQVVTETIYGLARRKADPIVPSKIICAVTKGVTEGFGQAFEAALARLGRELGVKADWHRGSGTWLSSRTGLFVEFPRYEDGKAVEDIRSDTDAVRFGDLVSEIVRTEALDGQSRIHLSLAGGRKTMSFHGGAAMSLFARSQDELSHVLVHPQEFEGCSDFWFPSKTERLVRHKDGRNLDARLAKIELALIPFLRVRDRLPVGLVAKPMDYAAHVAQTNAVLGQVPLSLELITSERRVRIGDLATFTLPNTEFALYQLMAEWKMNGHKGAGPLGIGQEHSGWLTALMFEYPETHRPNPVARYLDIYSGTFKTSADRADDMLNTITRQPSNDRQRRGNESNFAQWKARLMNALQGHLHDPNLADRFGAPRSPVKVRHEVRGKGGNRVVFGLRLEAREIMVRPE